ncbi:hypothetical protein IY71_09095 [Brucella suis]|uniref:Uncharacterized protein n=1 Tax=Brucella suis TaxID=29461 RepID=A0AAU8QWA7_BRUSS|nr:hypothetical protein IY71_09095 [Brucella suis]AIN88022.1 hypothetical protein IY72_08865 [Brucella suis]
MSTDQSDLVQSKICDTAHSIIVSTDQSDLVQSKICDTADGIAYVEEDRIQNDIFGEMSPL